MAERPLVEARPRIVGMRIHGGRVELAREVEVELRPGLNRVRLVDLAPPVDVRRCRIRASSALLVGLAEGEAETRAPRAPDLELAAETEAAEALVELLERIGLPESLDAFTPAETWAAIEHILAARAEAETELAALRARRPARTDDGRVRSARLELRLRSAEGGPCRLEIASDAGEGRWDVEYTIDVDDPDADAESGVEVRLGAVVRHETGISADDVHLELGGALAPSRAATRVRAPWIVRSDRGYDERSALLQARGLPVTEGLGDEDLPGERDAAEAPGEPPLPLRPADRCAVEPEVFRVPLGLIPCRARRTFRLRPAAVPHAHLTLELEPAEPCPPGRCTVTREGELSMPLQVPAAGPGRPWRLELGPEPRVVARREVRTRVRSEGLLQREDVHEAEVTIEVESSLERAVEIEVEDRIPVSVDPRLRIRAAQTSPDARMDAATGRAFARIQVHPDRVARVRFAYAIEAPHDYRLVQALGTDA